MKEKKIIKKKIELFSVTERKFQLHKHFLTELIKKKILLALLCYIVKITKYKLEKKYFIFIFFFRHRTTFLSIV